MKKNRLLSYLSLGVIFALFNVLAFVIPTNKTATFWTVYAFTVAAFAVQIPVWKLAFGNKDALESKFLGFSVIFVDIAFLILQLIVFGIFMIFPTLPVWLAVVVCSILLAISALCGIAGQAGANEINHVEGKVKVKRAFIHFLQADIEMLADSETDPETKAALKKLAEKVRFSDPMSHEMLGELEERISAKMKEIKTAEDKKSLVKEAETLLAERNKKCKILK